MPGVRPGVRMSANEGAVKEAYRPVDKSQFVTATEVLNCSLNQHNRRRP